MKVTKDSGIEWIGKIPSSWGLSKIGQVYKLRNIKVNDIDYPPLSVTNKGIVLQLETVAKTNAHEDRKLVKKGDFVINSRSDRRGSCGISDYDGSVSLINTTLVPLSKMNPGYYDWLFHTVQFGDEFYKFGHGIVDDLWTTNWLEMRKITIPLPSLHDQQWIADYLDIKCDEIDALYASIQAQVNILKEYKKSIITETVTKGLHPKEISEINLQTIKTISKSYKISKLKYVCNLFNGNSISDDEKSKYEDSLKARPYISSKDIDVNTQKIDYDNGMYIKLVDKSFKIAKKDSILLCIEGGSAGKKIAYLDRDVSFVNKLCCFECKTVCSKYLFYTLMSNYFTEDFDLNINGLIGGVSLSVLKGMNIVIPPIDEQNFIADYLDNKCSQIDKVIADKKEQLVIIDQYKKSLIYEYATGKKEVPHS